MDPYFLTIIQNSSARILIYNGDVDTECDFMMAQKFIREVVKQNNMKVSKNIQSYCRSRSLTIRFIL